MRKALVTVLFVLALVAPGRAQTVYQKDRWGTPLLYFDGNTIRQKDRWGAPLYYLDGNTLRVKDRWGAAVYYFDFAPSCWQLACVVLM